MLNFSKKCYKGLTVLSSLHVRLTYVIELICMKRNLTGKNSVLRIGLF